MSSCRVLALSILFILSGFEGEGQFEAPEPFCKISDPRVNESSGLAASTKRIYTLNDSGGKAEIYAFDKKGTVLGACVVKGAKNVDWEDLAIRGKHLYIADIGDNAGKRESVTIYKIAEPAHFPAVATPEVFELRYPDEPRNAEAFFVTGGVFTIVTKSSKTTRVYGASLPKAGSATTLRLVGELKLPGTHLVTGAACSHDGKRIALRSYTAGFEFGTSSGKWFEKTPTPIPMAAELQGEAIAYLPDNSGLITSSEFTPCPISITRRKVK